MPGDADFPSLGSLEAKVMRVAWEHAERFMSVRDVLGMLPGDPAYTTVMTVMNRLYEKGMLRRRRDGRAWSYRPATSREAYAATTMSEALRGARDRRAALLHFFADLAPEDAAALRRLVQDGESS